MVHLPGAEQIVGAGSTPLPAPSVSISDNYLSHGFQTGVTEVYLAVKQNGPGLNFPVNLVGGMAAPNFGVSGLARDLGPVGGDLANLLAGKFDPSDFFGNLSGTAGKLLGAISIIDIIKSIDPDEAESNAQAPQISSNFVYPGDDDTKPPTAIDTKLSWNPTVRPDSLGFFQPNALDMTTNLLVTAEIYTPISNPAQTTYTVHGELTNFELVLFGSDASFIGITFSSFTFDSKTGAKTSVQPNIDTVTFLGPLTFIQDLSQLLSSLGGPSIDVTAAGIDASYTLALPDITVGIFSLTNLSLSGGVNIPLRRLPGPGALFVVHPGQPVPPDHLHLRRRRLFRAGHRCRRDRGNPGGAGVRRRRLDQLGRGQRRGLDHGRDLLLAPDGAPKTGSANWFPAGGRQPLGARDHPDLDGVLPRPYLPRPRPVLRDGHDLGERLGPVLLSISERHHDKDLRRRIRPRLRRRHQPVAIGTPTAGLLRHDGATSYLDGLSQRHDP